VAVHDLLTSIGSDSPVRATHQDPDSCPDSSGANGVCKQSRVWRRTCQTRNVATAPIATYSLPCTAPPRVRTHDAACQALSVELFSACSSASRSQRQERRCLHHPVTRAASGERCRIEHATLTVVPPSSPQCERQARNSSCRTRSLAVRLRPAPIHSADFCRITCKSAEQSADGQRPIGRERHCQTRRRRERSASRPEISAILPRDSCANSEPDLTRGLRT